MALNRTQSMSVTTTMIEHAHHPLGLNPNNWRSAYVLLLGRLGGVSKGGGG